MKNVCFPILILLVFFSCQRKEENFFRGELKQIEFPDEYHVEEEFFNTDSIGNLSLDIAGDYLMLKTFDLPFFIRMYNKHTGDFLGEYFTEGQGPNDFLGFSIVKIDYPYLFIKDQPNKSLKILNIEETILSRIPVIEKEINYRKVINPSHCFYLPDNRLLIKFFDGSDNGKGMYWIKYNPETEMIEEEIPVYNYAFSYNIKHKIATIADFLKPDGSKIATITRKLNQIDILDISDPSKSFSVTTSEERLGYDYLENTDEKEMPNYYYTVPFGLDDFIFVSYYDHNKKANNHEIHVIDWDGNPKFKLIIDRGLSDLTVDFEDGILYGLSHERVYRYDIKDILAKY